MTRDDAGGADAAAGYLAGQHDLEVDPIPSPAPRDHDVTDFLDPDDYVRRDLGGFDDVDPRDPGSPRSATGPEAGSPTPGRPWRPDVMLLVGALGGAIAVGGFAWRNARRLGVTSRVRRRMVGWIVGGVALSLAAAWLAPDRGSAVATAFDYGLRLVERIAAVALAVVVLREQSDADRRHRGRGGGYARAVLPAAVAVVLGGAALAGLTLAVVSVRPT